MPENRLTWVKLTLLAIVFSSAVRNVGQLCSHNGVELVILREVIHEWQDHVTEEDKPLSGSRV